MDALKNDTERLHPKLESSDEASVNNIDINTNQSVSNLPPVSIDTVLRKCGDLGRFQMIHYFFINLISMGAAVVNFYYVFALANPEHRCRLPANVWPNDTEYNPVNITYLDLVHKYIPKTKDGKSWERCVRFATAELNDTLVACPNGWVYDRSVFGYTFTEEANFVCSNESKRSWMATLMQFGGFALLLIGTFADKYGRTKTNSVIVIGLVIVCIITQAIVQWVPMSTETKFIILLFNQFSSGLTASCLSLVFILVLELTSSAHTSLAGNVVLSSFAFGEVIVTLFAYLARDWQILKWIDTIFIALVIPYLYFMPESILYMYSKRQYDRLETLLRRIASTNKRQESEWYPFYQEFLQKQNLLSQKEHKLTFFQTAKKIISHRSTVLKLFTVAFLGFTTLLLYTKISYGLAVMSISPYLGIIIGAAVEAAGYISGSLLINTKLARKGAFILMASSTIICVVLTPILLKLNPVATVIVAQLGKFFISATVAASWIFVPELFPTSIRSSANGLFMAFSRIGAIVSPIIDASINDDYLPYTFYASAGLAVIVIVSTLFLPETKYKHMHDEDDYVINRNHA